MRHNLRLIVDMSKADLEHFTRERRIQTERTMALRKDEIRISEQVDDEKRSKLCRLLNTSEKFLRYYIYYKRTTY